MKLNDALKYDVDSTWRQMYGHLKAAPEHRQAGSHTRGIAADALDDLAYHRTGEDAEHLRQQAELLRSEHPIYLWRGGVYQSHPNPDRRLHSMYDAAGNPSVAAQQAAELSGRIGQGDNTAIDELGHLLASHNHPAAPLIERLAEGEGIEHPYGYGISQRGSSGGDGPFEHSLGGGYWRSGYSNIRLGNHTDRPYFLIQPFAPFTEGQHRADRSFVLPSTKEEATQFAEAMRDVHPQFAEHTLRKLETTPAYTPEQRQDEERFRSFVGLPQIAEPEQAEHHHSLETALKYVTAKPEDMLHLLPHSGNASSLIWADLLDDHNHSDLAARVRREAEGSAVKRPQPEEGSSSQDDVQHLLHLKHPSPAIRALADGGESPVNTDYLVRALRLSPNHFDQDAGVWLAQGDIPHPHHAAKTHFDNLSNRQYAEAGLVPKLVDDTLYLLDWEHTPEELRDGYHAPAIRYHAPISDRKDLDGMVLHAEQLLRQRQEQQLV